jgi:hypothetical protein
VEVISSSIKRNNLIDGGKPRFKGRGAVPAIVMKNGTIEVMGLGAGSAGGFSTPVGQTPVVHRSRRSAQRMRLKAAMALHSK